MIKIALTGGTGLVGSRVAEILREKFDVKILSSKEMDITNRDNVFNVLKNLDFDVLIHFAAYTNVDSSEIEKEKAWNINVEGTKNVYDACDKFNKNFIYISTDFVFDGKKENAPFFEDSKPNPISYYGLTKYEGEKILKKGTIIRISYPYRENFEKKQDFVRKIKSLLEQGREVFMVNDSLIVPTFIDDIGYALKNFLLSENFEDELKIIHFVGSKAYSPYECGKIIAKAFNLDESLIKPISYDEYYKNKAKRPQFSDIRSKNNKFFNMGNFEQILKTFKKNFKTK